MDISHLYCSKETEIIFCNKILGGHKQSMELPSSVRLNLLHKVEEDCVTPSKSVSHDSLRDVCSCNGARTWE